MTRSIAWRDGAIEAVDQCEASQRLAIRGAPAIGVSRLVARHASAVADAAWEGGAPW